MIPFYKAFRAALDGQGLHIFLFFFVYVWGMWATKTLTSRKYLPFEGETPPLATTAIVPVYNEDPALFTSVLQAIRRNGVTELIVVVDGGAEAMVKLARPYADRVIVLPKEGKRASIYAAWKVCSKGSDVILVVDSDTVWADDMLEELLKAFNDPKVGGVTPRQSIFDRERNLVRRTCDWVENLRYTTVVPAQSVVGAVGCLAGRTIAYRRAAFGAAVEEMVNQHVFGVKMEVGDDRVLTSNLLRNGWKTVYQVTAHCTTDAPNKWPALLRQQLRWGRSSQRETVLSLGWLWRFPLTFFCFLQDIVIPFALFALWTNGYFNFGKTQLGVNVPFWKSIVFGYLGMMGSIGLRQHKHFYTHPEDLVYFPLFCFFLTFVLTPLRIIACATMFHQSWTTRKMS